MTSFSRIVEGAVLRLRCDACGSVFPHFLFSGEEDSDTAGLYSASCCGKDEVTIVEVDASVWDDSSRTGLALVEQVLNTRLSRNDLKVVSVLRIEPEGSAIAGSSFSDFRKAYKPPVLIYSCVCCGNGEGRVIEEITLEDFQGRGGRIVLTGRLKLLATN
jgi:hypothetical protein